MLLLLTLKPWGGDVAVYERLSVNQHACMAADEGGLRGLLAGSLRRTQTSTSFQFATPAVEVFFSFLTSICCDEVCTEQCVLQWRALGIIGRQRANLS